eukprot:CAMPEP_0197027894 /NCGR_PEP_ID=MMETSP1384-20130603/7748_1 /TAXON_ID=29189 /ORGANISM="Ammonia sp." /LENGTH=802 /DNA_ID=CAMNT_0042456817 /DNA_START=28 /DNA_END=2436 /DNA_ORIENTATION=+
MGACLSDRSLIDASFPQKQPHCIKNQRTLSSHSATTKSPRTPLSSLANGDTATGKDGKYSKSTELELSTSSPDTPIITCITSIVHHEQNQSEDTNREIHLRLASAIQTCTQQQLIKLVNQMEARKATKNIIVLDHSQDTIVSIITGDLSSKHDTEPVVDDEEDDDGSNAVQCSDKDKQIPPEIPNGNERCKPHHQATTAISVESKSTTSCTTDKNDSLQTMREQVFRYNPKEGTKCKPQTESQPPLEPQPEAESSDEEETSDSDKFIKGTNKEISMDTKSPKASQSKPKKLTAKTLKYNKSLSAEQSSTDLKDVPNSPFSQSCFESITKLTEIADIDDNGAYGLHSPGNETMVKKPSITMSQLQLSSVNNMCPGAVNSKHKTTDCTAVTPSDCTVTPLSRSRLSARLSLKFNLMPITAKSTMWKNISYDGVDNPFYYTDEEEVEDGEEDELQDHDDEHIPHVGPQLLLPPAVTTTSHDGITPDLRVTGKDAGNGGSHSDMEVDTEMEEEEDASISCSYQFYQSFKRASIERAAGRNITHMIHTHAQKQQQQEKQQLQVFGKEQYVNDITVQSSAQSSTMETIYDEEHILTKHGIPYIQQQTSSDKTLPNFPRQVKLTPDSLIPPTFTLQPKSQTCTPSNGNATQNFDGDMSKSEINYSMNPQISSHSLSFDSEHEGHPSPMTPITPFTPFQAANGNMNICCMPPIISDHPPLAPTMLTAPTMSNDDMFLSELEQTPSMTLQYEGNCQSIYHQYATLQRRPCPPAHAFNYYSNHKSDFDDEQKLPAPLSPSNDTDSSMHSTPV